MDLNNPTLSSSYTSVLTDLATKDAAALKWFESESHTNVPVGTKRLNPTSKDVERWSGSAWVVYDSRLTDHLADTVNPHNVTAAQVGAPTTSDFNNHTSNVSNPHGTTAAQVGAPTTAAFNAHTANTSNPHSTTAAQVGALAAANNLSDVANVATARASLGLGSIALQAASGIAVTGGTLTGISSFRAANLAVIAPVNDVGADLGSASFRWSRAYLNEVRSNNIEGDSDISVKFSGTTYWVFGQGVYKDFRPNSVSQQKLGHELYPWAGCYADTFFGNGTAIRMADGGDGHIRYLAGATGEHYFYGASGGTLLFAIQNTGKIYFPVVGRPSYFVHPSYGTNRTFGAGLTLSQTQEILATFMRDVGATGIIG